MFNKDDLFLAEQIRSSEFQRVSHRSKSKQLAVDAHAKLAVAVAVHDANAAYAARLSTLAASAIRSELPNGVTTAAYHESGSSRIRLARYDDASRPTANDAAAADASQCLHDQ